MDSLCSFSERSSQSKSYSHVWMCSSSSDTLSELDIITPPSTPLVPPNSPTNSIHSRQPSRILRHKSSAWKRSNSKMKFKNTFHLIDSLLLNTTFKRRPYTNSKLRDEIAAWERWRARMLAGRPPDPPFLFPLRMRSLPFDSPKMHIRHGRRNDKNLPKTTPTDSFTHSGLMSRNTLRSSNYDHCSVYRNAKCSKETSIDQLIRSGTGNTTSSDSAMDAVTAPVERSHFENLTNVRQENSFTQRNTGTEYDFYKQRYATKNNDFLEENQSTLSKIYSDEKCFVSNNSTKKCHGTKGSNNVKTEPGRSMKSITSLSLANNRNSISSSLDTLVNILSSVTLTKMRKARLYGSERSKIERNHSKSLECTTRKLGTSLRLSMSKSSKGYDKCSNSVSEKDENSWETTSISTQRSKDDKAKSFPDFQQSFSECPLKLLKQKSDEVRQTRDVFPSILEQVNKHSSDTEHEKIPPHHYINHTNNNLSRDKLSFLNIQSEAVNNSQRKEFPEPDDAIPEGTLTSFVVWNSKYSCTSTEIDRSNIGSIPCKRSCTVDNMPTINPELSDITTCFPSHNSQTTGAGQKNNYISSSKSWPTTLSSHAVDNYMKMKYLSQKSNLMSQSLTVNTSILKNDSPQYNKNEIQANESLVNYFQIKESTKNISSSNNMKVEKPDNFINANDEKVIQEENSYKIETKDIPSPGLNSTELSTSHKLCKKVHKVQFNIDFEEIPLDKQPLEKVNVVPCASRSNSKSNITNVTSAVNHTFQTMENKTIMRPRFCKNTVTKAKLRDIPPHKDFIKSRLRMLQGAYGDKIISSSKGTVLPTFRPHYSITIGKCNTDNSDKFTAVIQGNITATMEKTKEPEKLLTNANATILDSRKKSPHKDITTIDITEVQRPHPQHTVNGVTLENGALRPGFENAKTRIHDWPENSKKSDSVYSADEPVNKNSILLHYVHNIKSVKKHDNFTTKKKRSELFEKEIKVHDFNTLIISRSTGEINKHLGQVPPDLDDGPKSIDLSHSNEVNIPRSIECNPVSNNAIKSQPLEENMTQPFISPDNIQTETKNISFAPLPCGKHLTEVSENLYLSNVMNPFDNESNHCLYENLRWNYWPENSIESINEKAPPKHKPTRQFYWPSTANVQTGWKQFEINTEIESPLLNTCYTNSVPFFNDMYNEKSKTHLDVTRSESTQLQEDSDFMKSMSLESTECMSQHVAYGTDTSEKVTDSDIDDSIAAQTQITLTQNTSTLENIQNSTSMEVISPIPKSPATTRSSCFEMTSSVTVNYGNRSSHSTPILVPGSALNDISYAINSENSSNVSMFPETSVAKRSNEVMREEPMCLTLSKQIQEKADIAQRTLINKIGKTKVLLNSKSSTTRKRSELQRMQSKGSAISAKSKLNRSQQEITMHNNLMKNSSNEFEEQRDAITLQNNKVQKVNFQYPQTEINSPVEQSYHVYNNELLPLSFLIENNETLNIIKPNSIKSALFDELKTRNSSEILSRTNSNELSYESTKHVNTLASRSSPETSAFESFSDIGNPEETCHKESNNLCIKVASVPITPDKITGNSKVDLKSKSTLSTIVRMSSRTPLPTQDDSSSSSRKKIRMEEKSIINKRPSTCPDKSSRSESLSIEMKIHKQKCEGNTISRHGHHPWRKNIVRPLYYWTNEVSVERESIESEQSNGKERVSGVLCEPLLPKYKSFPGISGKPVSASSPTNKEFPSTRESLNYCDSDILTMDQQLSTNSSHSIWSVSETTLPGRESTVKVTNSVSKMFVSPKLNSYNRSDSSITSVSTPQRPDFEQLQPPWPDWETNEVPGERDELQQYRDATKKAWRMIAQSGSSLVTKQKKGIMSSKSRKILEGSKSTINPRTCVEYLKRRLEQEETRLQIMTRRKVRAAQKITHPLHSIVRTNSPISTTTRSTTMQWRISRSLRTGVNRSLCW